MNQRSTGDTVALIFNRDFTREQHDALVAVFWAFHPTDWPAGGKVVFPSGLEVTVKVVKNFVCRPEDIDESGGLA